MMRGHESEMTQPDAHHTGQALGSCGAPCLLPWRPRGRPQGAGVGQAAPPGPGRTRLPWRAGLVSVRGRLGEHAGPEKGDLTGPTPVDRGKYGSEIHLTTKRTGLPLPVALSGANLHDSKALMPPERRIPPIRPRRGPRRRRPGKLHGDKEYDYSRLRRVATGRGIQHRIAPGDVRDLEPVAGGPAESSAKSSNARTTSDRPRPSPQGSSSTRNIPRNSQLESAVSEGQETAPLRHGALRRRRCSEDRSELVRCHRNLPL